ncbi:MAG: hypothetical protein JKY67_20580 [Pseudomonadales bacterium]|nr:hypothetical protein [Pseudomonadales bacterium]
MQLPALLLGIILGLSSVAAMAGSGHDHGHGHSHSYAPVDQATAKTNATNIVAGLVNRNKLEKSWASVTANSVEKKEFKGKSEWVAVFVNDKITDTDKQKLYVFLTLGGKYIAANFTGV